MSENKKSGITLGLIPRIIIAIAAGILVGSYLPDIVTQIAITFSGFFGKWLNFVIPLMILAFVSKGIADLGEGAGKLLGITVGISYGSTLIAGSLSYLMASTLFPKFISQDQIDMVSKASGEGLKPLFSIPLDPLLDVTGALVFAFMIGISISWLRGQGKGEYWYGIISEFNGIINKVLSVAVIPFLPFFIFGNFANMAKAGSVGAILTIFLKIFACIIILHILYVSAMFFVAGSYTGKNPIEAIKNQITGYMTAVGTQSSAATIPVNTECARRNGVSKAIREFVVPLCATVHMPGSMITLTSCCYTILFLYGMPVNYFLILQFIAVLGIAMVAAPGAPGGAVMSALPFVGMIGFATDSPQASLLITLYLTQDSFGTAANVSGDNAVALIVDKYYFKNILKREKTQADL